MKLSGIAALVGGTVSGDPETLIAGAAGLEDAGPGQITYLLKASSLEKAVRSGASAVIVQKPEPRLEEAGKAQVVHPDPQFAFVRLLEHFYRPERPFKGISPHAFVSGSAKTGEDVVIYPAAYVSDRARVGRGSVLYPGVYVGEDSVIGEDCVIYPGVTVRERVRIGNRVIIHAGTVIGADGFGYIFREGRHVKIPQVGGVIIEDDVEIGACTTIDRATTGDTVIGRGTKIDNLVQVAHNVKIGQGCLLVSQVGIAGSSTIGNYVVIAGQAAVADHATLDDGVIIGARGAVMPNVELKKGAYAGTPVIPHRQWLRSVSLFEKLPELAKTIAEMEKKIAALERRVQDDERG